MCFGIRMFRKEEREGARRIGGNWPDWVGVPALGNSNVGWSSKLERSKDVEETSCLNWLRRDGKKGRKRGIERKWL